MKHVLTLTLAAVISLLLVQRLQAENYSHTMYSPEPGDGVVIKDFGPVSPAQFPENLTMIIDATEVDGFENDNISLRVEFDSNPDFNEHEPLTDPSGYQYWNYEPDSPTDKYPIDGRMHCQWSGSGTGECFFWVGW